MSTTDYLKNLDHDQLIYARNFANEMINKIEDEGMVTLWVVEGVHINIAHYKKDDFQKAKIKLCEAIMSDEFSSDYVGRDHPRISRERVYASEALDYLKDDAGN